MLARLMEKNPDLPLYHVEDSAFGRYGRLVEEYDFTPLLTLLEDRVVPEEGNAYTGLDAEMTATPLAAAISRRFYAGMPLQVGYCNGNNSMLNALEYHKGSEIDVAGTGLVLLLADLRSVQNNTLDSSCVQGFYLPAGRAVELYATTLHFAPCRVDDSGFKSLVILPQGTNAPLEGLEGLRSGGGEDALLWMANKWMLAHPDSVPAAKGAYVGINGSNLQVCY